ncbi:hypothetical protein SEA_PATIO_76 [Gordonia phage Patio]|uniref:Uncharacterized protein n=1 Tax=Gordonia phage Patio TaxID=2041515 RepID=A0A2D2W4N6_9CAUD|nr:hypothetical protein KNT76_gp76 [Gordonia phage Patio]ATS93157.1 hypothetical protein SEA_PATIO_76 [Gordonia phage Patio]
MTDLVAVPHGQCNTCGHTGELVDVWLFTVLGTHPGKGCAKCHQTVMTRRWTVEKPTPDDAS